MNQVKTVSLLSLLAGLLVGIGYMIGGSGGALIGLVIAAVTNFFSWYSSDKIALAAYQAQPIAPEQAPELYQMVKTLSDRAQLPMPKLYLVPTPALNAFATGRDPDHAAVAVTQGIVQTLSKDELEGVLAHELTHIQNRDTLTQAVAATVGGAISYIAQVMQFSLMFGGGRNREGGNPLGALAAIVLAPMAASVIQMAISRTREFEADAGAARLTGKPRALASALQRLEAMATQRPMAVNPSFSPLMIVNALPRQVMGGLFRTHPTTEQRIKNLLKVEQELLALNAQPKVAGI
ncbi:MAG: M48 family metalloprotease [Kaiparowitsia implicata GSE-PSE-MK54-09C]|jgi:heat shock protein HtpX|nr:M48 family metalloprotease [Kaiparowitsia implicata GSE-PSE-MK54-09C]